MSTNYFHHYPGEEPRHIGKFSVGWQFMFRGYGDTPFGLVSWAGWKNYLDRVGGEIRGGDAVITAVEFSQLVNRSMEGKSHYVFLKEKHPEELPRHWQDAAGWTFRETEFW